MRLPRSILCNSKVAGFGNFDIIKVTTNNSFKHFQWWQLLESRKIAKNGNFGLPEVANIENFGMPEVANIGNFGLHEVAKIGNFGLPKVANIGNFGLPKVANIGNFGLPKVANFKVANFGNF